MRNSGVELAVTNSEKTDVKTNERQTQQNEPSTTKGNFHTVKISNSEKTRRFQRIRRESPSVLLCVPIYFPTRKRSSEKGNTSKGSIPKAKVP